MRRIAVYGGGNKALDVEMILAKYLRNEAECRFAVENKQMEKIGTYMRSKLDAEKSLEIISLDACVQKYRDREIDGVVFPTSYHLFDWREIYGLCIGRGIAKQDIFAVPIDILKKKELDQDDISRILTPYGDLNQIYHLDIHIIENCNLKCKGCAHFSSLVTEKDTAVSLEDYLENLQKLKSLVPNICHIALLGGEPLLHPELGEIIKITGEIYPYAQIGVVTNGILIPKLSEECYQLMRQYGVKVMISKYPAFQKMEEIWTKALEAHEVPYKIHDFSEFERRLWKEPIFNGALMTKRCGHDLCMKDHYISRCPMTAFIHYYNSYFGKSFPDNGKVDICKMSSGKELLEELEKPSGLCDYCCARDQCLEQWDAVTEKTIQAGDWLMTNIDSLKIERGEIL